MKLGDRPKTYNDVVRSSDSLGNFDRKTMIFNNLAVDVEPGSVITSAGDAYTSGDDAILCLSYAKAGSTVPVIVADQLIYIAGNAVIDVMGDTVGKAALEALTKTGKIRLCTPDAE